MKRRGFLTPDTFEGATEICRPLSVPLPLLHYVGGALSELTIAHNWEQFGTMTPEEAAERFTAILAAWQGDCGDGGTCEYPADPEFDIDIIIKIIRRGAGGHTEELVDGVWQEPTGDYEVPPVTARTEPLEADRLCLAAANAANVLAELYEEVTDAIAIELSVASVINAIVNYAVLVVGAFAGPTAAAYASFGKNFLDIFIDTADVLGSDVWNNEFTDELTCFLLEQASDSAGVVTFNWPELRSGITDKFLDAGIAFDTDRALLWGQVGYLFDILAAGGIDHAGTTTAITTYDCACPETFEHSFFSGAGQDGFLATLTPAAWSFLPACLATWDTGAEQWVGCQNGISGTTRHSGAVVERVFDEREITLIAATGHVSHSSNVANTALLMQLWLDGVVVASVSVAGAGNRAVQQEFNPPVLADRVTILCRGSRVGSYPTLVAIQSAYIEGLGVDPFI